MRQLTQDEFARLELTHIDARNSIDRRYGPSSKNYKSYHNVGHFDFVTTALAKISLSRGVPAHERMLLVHAATYHDYFNGICPGLDEELSAKAAVRALRFVGAFSKADEAFVKKPIIGTACGLDGARIVQKADDMDEYAQMLADADLSNLGSPTEAYWPIAKSLHYEFHPDTKLEGEALIKFADFEIEVQKAHSYYTPEAAQLFPNKLQNIEFLQRIVDTGSE